MKLIMEQTERIMKLKRDVEAFEKLLEINKDAINYLVSKKKRNDEESRLLTEFRNYASQCIILIDAKKDELRQMEK